MLLSSGCLHRKWRAFLPGRHLPYKNMILPYNTAKDWYTEMLMHFLERITLTLSILLQLHSFLYLQKICDNNNSLTVLYMKFMKHFFEIIQPHPGGINFLFLGTNSFGLSYICMMAWYVANILHHLALKLFQFP